MNQQQDSLHSNETLGLGQTGMLNHIPNSNHQVSKKTHLVTFYLDTLTFLITIL